MSPKDYLVVQAVAVNTSIYGVIRQLLATNASNSGGFAWFYVALQPPGFGGASKIM